MNINEIKKETSIKLKVDIKSLDYITEDFMNELSNAKEEDIEINTDADNNDSNLSGVYCNSITYNGDGYIYYNRGEKGTANYGCGSNPYKLLKNGTTIQQIGSCSGGRIQYLISW